MQIGERYFDDSGKLVRQATYDPNPSLLAAKRARELHENNKGDWRPVATVPGWLVTLWLKEAGVKWNDPAANDVIRRKMMDGEYSAFRVAEGNLL